MLSFEAENCVAIPASNDEKKEENNYSTQVLITPFLGSIIVKFTNVKHLYNNNFKQCWTNVEEVEPTL